LTPAHPVRCFLPAFARSMDKRHLTEPGEQHCSGSIFGMRRLVGMACCNRSSASVMRGAFRLDFGQSGGQHGFYGTKWLFSAHQHHSFCNPAREKKMAAIEKEKVVAVLNRILEAELAGVVRYTHYSFLVFGFGRIPIVSWLRQQADESLLHAQQAGEWITTLESYPSLAIGHLLDTHVFDIGTILRESLEAEQAALNLYRDLLALVENRSVALEEFARQMINAEEMHAGEVKKMLRKPGEMTTPAQ